ncbi:DUF368 domain-containing protein [Mesonia maritima]|uniref:Membrane protein n=1 Tax=Mesonia maritima TaxID=1793873 RepID=A0ABU1K7H8_9FLAO|nr:DUF368 domain-containing protein [Mesonia maritima]MDR6300437.1 putative membrane protein [Mesonia maritima]
MQERSFKDYFIVSLKGIAMGAADTVPGVSGGTIAFISGIYEELITSISNVNLSLLKTWKNHGFKEMWKSFNGNFVLALLSGILISVFTLMRLANYLLEHHPILIWSFFFGLVIASIWYVGRQIEQWNIKSVAALIIGAVAAYYVTTIPVASSDNSLIYLFFSGSLAVCAMILPGISGAFILVLLGAYQEITQAVHDFNFKKIGLVGLGAICGLLAFSKLLKWLFTYYKTITLAVLTGFIAGSLNKIWPWKEVLESITLDDKEIVTKEQSVLPWNYNEDPQLWFAIILMLAGFFLILILEKLAEKKPETNAANTDV